MNVRSAGPLNPPGVTIGLAGTIAVHAAVVAVALLSAARPGPKLPPAYAVELVAAPAPAPKTRAAPEATPAPPPEPPAPPVKAPAKVKTAPVAPPKTKPRPVETHEEPRPKTSTTATPLPGETPSTGTDVANVKTPGLAFPYPEYLRNIVNQVYKRWGSPSTPLRAELRFYIHRDGSISDIGFVQRSGNFSFDLDAQGAVEAAGNSHAFGPLPDGWEADILPVTFYFQPPSR